MEQEVEAKTPFDHFVTELTGLIGKYHQSVSANEMIKAFRHLEVDLMASMMIAYVTHREMLDKKSAEFNTAPCEVCDLGEISELHQEVERKPYGDMSHHYKPKT